MLPKIAPEKDSLFIIGKILPLSMFLLYINTLRNMVRIGETLAWFEHVVFRRLTQEP
jgi:hypothetical protein